MNTNIRNSYIKNNRIRTKLLLFIDNEIQSKTKKNNKNLKFNCKNETSFKISFEETFTQKETIKYGFSFSNILITKKNDNSDKSVSTIDGSSNKIIKKSVKKNKSDIKFKSFSEEDNLSNKSLNIIICFREKNYSIKNLSKQSSTFLILPKQKNATEYLKTLCNNLKICKKYKKPTKRNTSINIKTNLFDLSKDKKSPKKSNGTKFQKSKNNSQYTYSLFKKPQKRNFVFNPKNKISTNSIFLKIKQKEEVVF